MTCIAVLKDKKNSLWFASDRRLTSDYNIIEANEPKTKLMGNILVAGAGTAWICDLILERYTFPDIDPEDPENFWTHNILYPDLIRWLREEGYVDRGTIRLNTNNSRGKEDKDEEYAILIIGANAALFELTVGESAIFITKVDTPYATGSGGPFALGSLRTTEKSGMKIKDRLILACKVAADCNSACDKRIDILTNKGLF